MLNEYKLEIKWGLIFCGMMMLWMVGEKVLGFHSERIDQHVIITNFIAIPAFIVYYFALVDKRNQLGGFMSWKQGFICGVLIAVVVMLFTPLMQYLISEVISPEYFPNAIAHAVKTGQATQADAEANFNLQNYLIQATIGSIVMGAITAAIMALFVRRKPSLEPA